METSESQFSKKEPFELTKTDFLASFLRQQSTVNLSFRLVKTSFLSTGNSILLFQVFFLLIENITEIWGKSNFKD